VAVNKSELVSSIARSAGVEKRQAESVLSAFFDTVQREAKGGSKVAWPGFGTFKAAARQARMGRTSPTDPTPKRIPASTALRFTPSAALKEFMNAKGTARATKRASPAKGTKRTTKKRAAKRS
jgi:DNA-binding protein HU-beta